MAWRKRRYVESSGSETESSRGRSRGRYRKRRRRRQRSSSSSYTAYSRSSPSIFRRRGRREADEDSEYSLESESLSHRKDRNKEKEAEAPTESKGIRSHKEQKGNQPDERTDQKSKTSQKPKALKKVAETVAESEKNSANEKSSETPSAPQKPKASEKPKVEKPKTPQKLKAPEKLNSPEKPKTPEKPKALEKLKAPEKPNSPEKPKAVEKPKTPEKPKAAEKPKTLEKPRAAEGKPKAGAKPKASDKSKVPVPKGGEKPKVSETSVAGENREASEPKAKIAAKAKVHQKPQAEKQDTEKTSQRQDAKHKRDKTDGGESEASKKLKLTEPKTPEKAAGKVEKTPEEADEKKAEEQASRSPKSSSSSISQKGQKSPKSESKLESPPEAEKLEKPENNGVAQKPTEKEPEKSEKPKEELLGKTGLDTLALQRSLSQDTQNLQLMLLQAKRDLDDRRDTLEKQERREKEYYRGDYGEPLGPENRLLLEEALGQGAFSTVYRCRDMKAEGERHYAVKFIRKNSVLRTATEQEVKLMRRLRTQASELDPVGARCFLGLAGPEVIEHEGHLALCFQLQRCDLRSALKRWGQGAGLPLGLVRNYARNIFLALRALKLVNIVHSDLKPDNLLVSMDKMSVKLSDFGSAMDVKDRLRAEKAAESLQPRFYRAPEVILGQPYDTQIDVWSAGCTVFEMVTGRFLFTGRDNNQMLFQMMKHLGAFSRKFVGSGKLSDKHFRREDGAFRCGADANGEPLKFIGREDFPRPQRPIMEELQEPLQLDGNADTGQVAAKALVELILACITSDPARRVDPDAALSTCFLRPSGNRVQ